MNGIAIDMTKPGAAECYRMLQMYYALKIEVTTGLRHSRGSVMNLARREFNITKATKKGVMEELAKLLKEKHGLEVNGGSSQ